MKTRTRNRSRTARLELLEGGGQGEAVRCVFCDARLRYLRRGRVQGFWIAAITTAVTLLLAAWLVPGGFQWMITAG